MTTEEALAVAESVQFDSERRGFRQLRGPKGPRVDDVVVPRASKDEEGEPPKRLERRRGKNNKKDKHSIHIEKVGTMRFSEAQQFAEATKGRYDAAERGAMRRAIYYANIHPAIKVALLQHAPAVQFSDAGNEVPSVPLSWVMRAARGILQMANTYGVGGEGMPGGKFSPYIDDAQDAPDRMEMVRQHPHWPEYLAKAEGDEEAAMEEMFADVDWEGEEMPPYSDPIYLRNQRTWGRVPAQYKAGNKTLWAASGHWKHPEMSYERVMGRPPPPPQQFGYGPLDLAPRTLAPHAHVGYGPHSFHPDRVRYQDAHAAHALENDRRLVSNAAIDDISDEEAEELRQYLATLYHSGNAGQHKTPPWHDDSPPMSPRYGRRLQQRQNQVSVPGARMMRRR